MAKEDLVGAVESAAGRVDYKDTRAIWQDFGPFLVDLAQEQCVNDVAELGGGANPFVADTKWGFANHRVVIDISADELAKAPGDVETRVADLCQPIRDGHNAYDLVFSVLLCEHLPDPRTFHENCFNLLRPGGHSVHFHPTLSTFPFVLNKLMPEKATRSLIRKFQPGRLELTTVEKFPAYYRWCTGPTRRAVKRYQELGFEVDGWQATFGHYYYYAIPPLHALERAKTRLLLRHPVPALASYAVVVLRKPA